jgi:predicted metal-dependent HD superfamily phosphohydrolase
MEDRFKAWCEKGGADVATAASLWSALAAHYSEPHRHYHTLDHLRASLAELDRCGDDQAIEGAIWFHDVIYDPHRSDNEDASVSWFLDQTRGWLQPLLSGEIIALIEATDFRRPRHDRPREALMVDVDLAVLSAPAGEYDAYCEAIRREYSHVDEESFHAGRAKVMAGFLRGPIYRTEFFTAREEQARANIQRELESLSRAKPG